MPSLFNSVFPKNHYMMGQKEVVERKEKRMAEAVTLYKGRIKQQFEREGVI
jgi:hypothetical protein